ncbi:MAG: hypothetical protein GC201_14105 [Alphaproteobacteria bacterium]|nr:hypothetical protein [Alphaproteobacteria bacterium]
MKLAVAVPVIGALPRIAFAAAYEPPVKVPPSKALPPDLVKGENFEVVGEVTVQGFSDRYVLSTPYTAYDVVTRDLLQKRIAETRAIGELLKVKQTDAFKAGFAAALKSPYKGVKALVTNPIETIKGVPTALWKFGRRIGEMFSGGRGKQEDTYGSELLGFSAVKRKIAYKLGVDVYSDNEKLQHEIDDVAYAGFAGGLAFKLAMIPVALPGSVGYTLDAIKFTRRANQILRDMAPEDLRIRNRKALEAMWATKDECDAFMDNPYFTPRHETIIALALEGMDGVENREGVVRRASRVDSALAAQLMQRSIEMTRSYHATVRPLTRIEELGTDLAFVTRDQGIAMAVPADHLLWTGWFDGATRAIAAFPAPGIRWRGVVVAGDLSRLARRQATSRGLLVESNTRDHLLPKEEWTPPEGGLELDDEGGQGDRKQGKTPPDQVPMTDPLPGDPGTGPEWKSPPPDKGDI